MYAWRVGSWGGTIKPDDAQTVLWTAPPTATKAATATARKTRAANERDDRPGADVQRRPVQQDLRPRRLHQPQVPYFPSLTAANHNRRALDYSRPCVLKQELRRACELRGAVWSLTPAKNTSRRCARCGSTAKAHREPSSDVPMPRVRPHRQRRRSKPTRTSGRGPLDGSSPRPNGGRQLEGGRRPPIPAVGGSRLPKPRRGTPNAQTQRSVRRQRPRRGARSKTNRRRRMCPDQASSFTFLDTKRQPSTHPKPSQTEIAYVRQRTGDDGEPRPPPPNATAPRAHIRALTDRATTVRALELLCLRRLITLGIGGGVTSGTQFV